MNLVVNYFGTNYSVDFVVNYFEFARVHFDASHRALYNRWASLAPSGHPTSAKGSREKHMKWKSELGSGAAWSVPLRMQKSQNP